MSQVILGGSSSVWAQLTLPNPPIGSVPFVFTDGATIAADVTNFMWDQVNFTLFATNGFKQKHGDITANPGVAGTINFTSGRFKLSAGQAVFTLTDAFAAIGDIIFTTLETVDATLTRVFGLCSVGGQIVFTGNANCTGAVTISFVIMKVS